VVASVDDATPSPAFPS